MLCFHFQSFSKNSNVLKEEDKKLVYKIKEKLKSIFKGEFFQKIISKKSVSKSGRIYDFLELSNGNFLILNEIQNKIEIWSSELTLISSNYGTDSKDLYSCFEHQNNKVMVGGTKVILLDCISLIRNELDVGHKGTITEFQSLPNDMYATASRDKSIRIWNMKGEVFNTLYHNDQVHRIIVKDNFLISPGWDGMIKFWNIEKNFKLEKEFKAHNGALYCVIYLNDCRMATCSNDKSVKIFNEFEEDQKLSEPDSVYALFELEDGRILSGGYFNEISIWKKDGGKFVIEKKISTGSHTWRIKKMRNGTIFSCHYDGMVQFWK